MRHIIIPLLCLLVPCSFAIAQDTEMDQAIERALEFLHRTQDQNGAWRVGNTPHPAITSLAVMAFLSAGHVPGEGPYGATVERGVRWVLTKQQPNGVIATDGGHEMYHHGICTLMLAEVVGMCEPNLAAEVRAKLEKAVQIILKAQLLRGEHRGGWRYRVQSSDADISVTGWQVMALRAAKNLGCDVPPERLQLAVDYIKRCQDTRSGGFRYMIGSHITVPCTGTSILALELCGKEQHRSPELLKAGSYLLQNAPTWNSNHFFYAVYYCSQAMFQLGGTHWAAFRPKLHHALLPNQKSNGSFDSRGGDGYGPNYGTAMAVLALTVEYRLLPIYQRGDDSAEAP
ncbi:MAG: prenyltransferase/squalene oxidase repeat-containing protein [Gemmataceae bacterium]